MAGKEYVVYTNLEPYWDGTYHSDIFSRKSAFKDAAETYIYDRILSGIPTKKPFIVTVCEDMKMGKRGDTYLKPTRRWEITITIKPAKVPKFHHPTKKELKVLDAKIAAMKK